MNNRIFWEVRRGFGDKDKRNNECDELELEERERLCEKQKLKDEEMKERLNIEKEL